MKRELQGTDPPNISNKMFENYEITLPDIQKQKEIKKELIEVYGNYNISRKKLKSSKSLQKSLINQIF
jgi:restriction endonuclease S subunit